MKKLIVKRGDMSGSLRNISASELEDLKTADDTPNFEPSELEVRLAALEEKAGITQADKDAARTALNDSA